MREWTGTTGRKIEGRVLARRGDRFQFELRDGSTPWVPITSLAPEDRAYLASLFPAPTNRPALPPKAAGAIGEPRAGAPEAQPLARLDISGVAVVPGKISARIPCEASPQFGYFLWIPPGLIEGRKYPIIYVLDPGGGKPGTANRYLKAAAFTGTLVAVSAESSNAFQQSHDAVLAMVADAGKRLPIDLMRQYASGFSGGSRSAGWLGDQLSDVPMAGVLCCGAGPGYKEVYKLSQKTALYGLCGSNCFNRWDMPRYFDAEPSKHKRLRFFVGNHDWAGEDLIHGAMIWLQAHYLADHVRTQPALRPECESLLERVLKEVDAVESANPLAACELAEISTFFAFSSAHLDRLRARFNSIRQSPAVLRELDALHDEEALIRRHFAPGFDYRQGADPEASKAAATLARKHAQTSRGPVLAKLVEPCVKP